MKLFLSLLALALCLTGCLSLEKPPVLVTIAGAVCEETTVEALDFTNIGYIDERLLIRVSAPSEMAGQTLAISFQDGWGKNVRFHGDPDQWNYKTGSQLVFEAKASSLHKSAVSGRLTINANKIINLRVSLPSAYNR